MRETMTSHWSLTLDHRFQPVRAAKIQNNNNNSIYRVPDSSSNNNNIVKAIYRVSNPSRKSRELTTTSSTSSFALSTRQQRGDSDVKRKQRISSYKAYAVEGKIKASVRKSFRWMKNKYTSFVHGY